MIIRDACGDNGGFPPFPHAGRQPIAGFYLSALPCKDSTLPEQVQGLPAIYCNDRLHHYRALEVLRQLIAQPVGFGQCFTVSRSEERRVGKEWRCRWAPCQ